MVSLLKTEIQKYTNDMLIIIMTFNAIDLTK